MSAERSTVEILRAARERISDPEHWTTNTFARDASAYLCAVDAPKACQWCAEGSLAVELLANGESGLLVRHVLEETSAYEFLTAAARQVGNPALTPVHINDDRGHKATLAMYDRAIELAEAAS